MTPQRTKTLAVGAGIVLAALLLWVALGQRDRPAEQARSPEPVAVAPPTPPVVTETPPPVEPPVQAEATPPPEPAPAPAVTPKAKPKHTVARATTTERTREREQPAAEPAPVPEEPEANAQEEAKAEEQPPAPTAEPPPATAEAREPAREVAPVPAELVFRENISWVEPRALDVFIDGRPVVTRSQLDRSSLQSGGAIPIGELTPGPHNVDVKLRLAGSSNTFTYMRGYAFTLQRSAVVHVAGPSRILIDAEPKEKLAADWKDRMRLDIAVEPLR